jgi:hypothetical protein
MAPILKFIKEVNLLAIIFLGLTLSGCTDFGDRVSETLFSDPAIYDFYDCKQLSDERKNLANQEAENRRLIAKAQTGVAGTLVGELAYRDDYLKIRAKSKRVEDAWQQAKCPAVPTVAANGSSSPAPTPPKSDSSVPPTTSSDAIY